MHNYKDITGQTFGRLKVLSRVPGPKRAKFLCQCDCGKCKEISGTSLRQKKNPTRSCGCLRDEINSEMRLGGIRPSSAKLRELYEDGFSARQIAERYEVGESTIFRWLKEDEVAIRSLSMARKLTWKNTPDVKRKEWKRKAVAALRLKPYWRKTAFGTRPIPKRLLSKWGRKGGAAYRDKIRKTSSEERICKYLHCENAFWVSRKSNVVFCCRECFFKNRDLNKRLRIIEKSNRQSCCLSSNDVMAIQRMTGQL